MSLRLMRVVGVALVSVEMGVWVTVVDWVRVGRASSRWRMGVVGLARVRGWVRGAKVVVAAVMV